MASFDNCFPDDFAAFSNVNGSSESELLELSLSEIETEEDRLLCLVDFFFFDFLLSLLLSSSDDSLLLLCLLSSACCSCLAC